MTCIGFGLITENVARLRAFYTQVLKCPTAGDDTHAEIQCKGTHFVLYDKAASIADMAFSYDAAMGHGHATLSFSVPDVDAEYARLTQMGFSFMTQPQTYPWGARSVHLRDRTVTSSHWSRPPKHNNRRTDCRTTAWRSTPVRRSVFQKASLPKEAVPLHHVILLSNTLRSTSPSSTVSTQRMCSSTSMNW